MSGLRAPGQAKETNEFFVRIYEEVNKITGNHIVVPHIFIPDTPINFAHLFENLWIAIKALNGRCK